MGHIAYEEWIGTSKEGRIPIVDGDRYMTRYMIELNRAKIERNGTFAGNANLKYREGSVYVPSQYGISQEHFRQRLEERISGKRTFNHDEFPHNPIRSSSGKWGGRFSSISIDGSTGSPAAPNPKIPKAVGGTVGVEATFRDGTTATFGGSFEALEGTSYNQCLGREDLC